MRISKSAWAGLLLTLLPSLSPAASSSASTCSKDERHLAFTTNTGSDINLDLSPDGTTLVFDMLGDLYTVLVKGGTATRITHGIARDVRPVWSPDGQMIAFISDRDGGSSAPYLMEVKGDHRVRRIAPGAAAVAGVDGEKYLTHLEWMPGSSLIVAHNFMGYQVKINGSGEDAVTEIDGSRFDRYYGNGAALYRFAIDKTLTGSSDLTIGGGESRARMLRYSKGQRDLERLPELVSDAAESAAVSPDGRWVIYRDIRPKPKKTDASPHGAGTHVSSIRVYDQIQHVDRVLVGSEISKGWRDDGVEYAFSAIRRFAVSPDSKSVYLSYAGKVHRIELATGKNTIVPITVQIDQCLAPLIHNRFPIGDDLLEVFNTRSATQSPDGRHLVFNALRNLYVMALPSGIPHPLTTSTEGQFHPAYSPDGRWIAFVSWDEVTGGHVWRLPAAGGIPQKLTRAPGYYGPPAWSPDSTKLAVVGNSDIGKPRPGFQVNVYDGDLHVLSLSDRTEAKLPVIARLGDPITFSADGTRVFYTPYESAFELNPASVKVDGTDPRKELPKDLKPYYGATYVAMSPNGHYIAKIDKNNLSIHDCSSRGLRADGTCTTFQITASGAYDPRWRDSGDTLEWSYGRTYYRARIKNLLETLYAGTDSVVAGGVVEGVESIRIDLQVPRSRPLHAVALKDARIITMNGNLVIEKGTVVVRAGRIVQIGPSVQVAIPGDAEVMELNGKTIMPGLIDSHAHAYLARDLLPKNHWELLANLAFGVTTIKDPSNGGHHGFQYGELIESGKTVGPRIYGAAGLVRGIADLNSYGDAIGAVKSMKLLGGTFVKYHTGYSRQQRQWLFEAARREGLNVAAHYPTDNGNGQFNLTTIADGATTTEHDISEVLDLFDDVKTLLVQSGVGVSYAEAPSLGGRYHHAYWSTNKDDPRSRTFLRFDPPKTQWTPGQLPSTGLAPLYPSAEHVAAFLADIDRRGAKVLVGSHGNYDGIGMHWSMWAHARGGMSNQHVLRAATLHGAWGLGLEEELGSIEVGKLADLLILADNPLDDIRNTLSIQSVMKDGVLRESTTLDAIWPTRTPLPAWQYQGSAKTAQPR